MIQRLRKYLYNIKKFIQLDKKITQLKRKTWNISQENMPKWLWKDTIISHQQNENETHNGNTLHLSEWLKYC